MIPVGGHPPASEQFAEPDEPRDGLPGVIRYGSPPPEAPTSASTVAAVLAGVMLLSGSVLTLAIAQAYFAPSSPEEGEQGPYPKA